MDEDPNVEVMKAEHQERQPLTSDMIQRGPLKDAADKAKPADPLGQIPPPALPKAMFVEVHEADMRRLQLIEQIEAVSEREAGAQLSLGDVWLTVTDNYEAVRAALIEAGVRVVTVKPSMAIPARNTNRAAEVAYDEDTFKALQEAGGTTPNTVWPGDDDL